MIRSTLAVLSLAMPLLAAGQGRPDLNAGLLASYPFHGDAVDEVTRIPASALGTRPFEGHDGARNSALWFDGARAMVNLGAQLQPGRFTLSAWVRPESVDRPQAIISKVRNLPGHYQKNFELRLNPGGKLFCYVPSGASWDVVEGVRPLPAGRWTHVAATYDGARAQLYVDGVADGAPLAVRYEQTTTETFVGARPEGGGRNGRKPSGPTFLFAGGLDDVRVWNRALSNDEILIAAGRMAPPPEPARPPPSARPGSPFGPPPPWGAGFADDDDGGVNEALLVRAGNLVLRHDLACVRGDAEALARIQGRILAFLQDAERTVRNDRELQEQLRRAEREVQRFKGRLDAMSLDRVRTALVRLADGLWDDLAPELDEGFRPAPEAPRRGYR